MFLKLNFLNSNILNCNINENESFNKKELRYTTILRRIWSSMPRQKIYDHSTFNSKDYYCNKNGYKWFYEIQLSIQIGNTKEILNEIIRMCKLMNFDFHVEIELYNLNKVHVQVSNGCFKYDIFFPKHSYDKFLCKNHFM